MQRSTMIEIAVSLLTGAAAVAIGISVLIKGDSSTHALSELFILVVVIPV